MPIRPSERDKYPADWPQVVARIRARAKGRCEWCGVPQYAVGHRGPDGLFVREGGNGPLDASGQGLVWPSLEPLTYSQAREIADTINDGLDPWDSGRRIVIVMTTAHLDHDPTNCEDENLAWLCQRCHNRYDVNARRAGIAQRRRQRNGDLFAEAQE